MYEAEKLIAAGRVSFRALLDQNTEYSLFEKYTKSITIFKIEIIYYPVRNLILGYLPNYRFGKKEIRTLA